MNGFAKKRKKMKKSKPGKKKDVPYPKSKNPSEEEVAVIVDLKSNNEYYMFIIDFFKIEGKSYVVMVPYEPVEVRSKNAEVVILRSKVNKEGEQLYMSITDKKELNRAFDVFFKRFEEAEKKQVEQ